MTIGTCLHWAERKLAAAGVESPRLDARLLLQHTTGLSHAQLLLMADRALDAQQVSALEALVCRRAEREPLALITAQREFWSRRFELTPGVLVPRPETETLIETAFRLYAQRPPARILDLGVGSGCILLTLLCEWPESSGVGVDRDAVAVSTTKRNASKLGVGERALFVQGDMAHALRGPFDLVVSNPPYVAHGDIAGLQPEVRDFEPHAALDGGADGLDAYRAIAADGARLLATGGRLLLECGAGQAEVVSAIFEDRGFCLEHAAADLAGITRCLVFVPAPAATLPA